MRIPIVGTALAAAAIVTATALPAAATTTPTSTTTHTTLAAAIQPKATDRNIYVSETGCEIAGYWGQYWGAWQWFLCQPIYFQGESDPWWLLVTFP